MSIPDRLAAALADRYRLERELGQGGMATVYLAEDLKHHRKVAVKVLRPELAALLGADRFLREIEITANLQHPHILPLFDSGVANLRHPERSEGSGRIGTEFLYYVMPYVEGESLRDRLDRDARIPVPDALRMTIKLARALDAAHRQDILHRDIKPENILLREGEPVIADFGIALATRASDDRLTEVGISVGTVLYMSPEQATGERNLDGRSDLYSLACVLYEMVVGTPPHRGATARDVITARLLGPPDLREVRKLMPALAPVLGQALAAAPAERQPDMAAFAAALQELLDAAIARARTALRPAVLVGIAVGVVALALGWSAYRSRAERERAELLTRIEQLNDSADVTGAVLLAKRLGEPRDSADVMLWRRLARQMTIATDPPGARASWRALTGDTTWQPLGTTPTDSVWLPRSVFRLRLERDGSAPYEVNTWPNYASALAYGDTIRLPAAESLPPGMVLVQGGDITVQLPGLEGLTALDLPDYYIDRLEVTNRQFKEFVDAGGYADSTWWPSFERDGRPVSWADARRTFVDRTGRPGPSTWELGSYQEGLAEHPVAGLSWFEAAAYARFRGRALPTVYHWSEAAGTWAANWTVPRSNFGGKGTAPVGRFTGLGPWGTLDMAGNVREWCANASGRQRFILGGGWNDAEYSFTDAFAQSPWDRSATNGVRLAAYPTQSNDMRAALGDIQRPARDFLRERPASDAEFAVFRRLYAYDPRPLDARIEAADTTEDWIRQRVSVTAASGDERLAAYLYLPRRGSPPFQTVVYFPGSAALFQRSFENQGTGLWDFLPKNGRALLFPLYYGTFERGPVLPTDQPDTTAAYRERVGYWVRDFRRAVDYAVFATRSRFHAARVLRLQLGRPDRPAAAGPRAAHQGSRPLRGRLQAAARAAGSRPVQLRAARADPGAHGERPPRLLLPDRDVAAPALPDARHPGGREAARGVRRRAHRPARGADARDAGLAGSLAGTHDTMSRAVDRLTAALADRYRIERELGAGGMATVYLAEDLKHGRHVAIKVLHPELSAVIGAERFLAEIHLTAQLQHPHILGLIDSGATHPRHSERSEESGRIGAEFLYYVMPYVDGETLRTRLVRERQLRVRDAIRIAGEIASALEYAHKRNVIHRDIKPENILLQDDQVLVADFGIALAVSQAGGARLTQTGLSLGTPSYMSPEQAMGEKTVDARSDVYALGALTYEMLQGDPPFTGGSMQVIMSQLLTAKPRPLRESRPSVPVHVEAAVLTALEKLPADRQASAAEFARALTGEAMLSTEMMRVPDAALPPAAVTPALPPRRLAASALALVAAGAAAGWAVARLGGAAAPAAEIPTVTSILAPAGGTFGERRSLALSPDGRQLAFVFAAGDGTRMLWLGSSTGSSPCGSRAPRAPTHPSGRPTAARSRSSPAATSRCARRTARCVGSAPRPIPPAARGARRASSCSAIARDSRWCRPAGGPAGSWCRATRGPR